MILEPEKPRIIVLPDSVSDEGFLVHGWTSFCCVLKEWKEPSLDLFFMSTNPIYEGFTLILFPKSPPPNTITFGG